MSIKQELWGGPSDGFSAPYLDGRGAVFIPVEEKLSLKPPTTKEILSSPPRVSTYHLRPFADGNLRYVWEKVNLIRDDRGIVLWPQPGKDFEEYESSNVE